MDDGGADPGGVVGDDGGGGSDATSFFGGESDPRDHRMVGDLERFLKVPVKVLAGSVVVPAWRRATKGESVWPVRVAVLAAIALQFALPHRYAMPPRWLFPAVGAAVTVALWVAHPRRITKHTPVLRALSVALIVVMSFSNAGSGLRLITALLGGHAGESAGGLLLPGAAIWLTNVIVFAMWYWDLDRGGPAARANAMRTYPDFLFAQMTVDHLSKPDWTPGFIDYLYLSFTNATAFSPTDTLPMARWAKLTMMLQSSVSLCLVALVIARAVNILK